MNFNSRTHVECDAFPFRTTFSLSNFNSRTHVECDYDCIDCHVEYYNISTHALTWSATRRVCCNVEQTKFQLTHSRGVRPGLIDVCPGCKNFNSRTHVECDFYVFQTSNPKTNFNSRTHVECDQYKSFTAATKKDFNSRTHVECDSGSIRGILQVEFQLTHSRGVRQNHLRYDGETGQISTHALTWSATKMRLKCGTIIGFQLTHSRGVRQPGLLFYVC